MNQNGIINICKDLGCCDLCCLRYLGIRYHNAYENSKAYLQKLQDKPQTSNASENIKCDTTDGKSTEQNTNEPPSYMDVSNEKSAPTVDNTNSDTEATNSKNDEENGVSEVKIDASNGSQSPPMKRRRQDICASCLGLLQEDSWTECNAAVKEVMVKKQYDCRTFGCGLSSPIAAMLREKVICLNIKEAYADYDEMTVIPLKEVWKWVYGPVLASCLGLTLDSGSVSPLLVVLNMEYPDDLQELEVLKSVSPSAFRSRGRKHAAVEYTRRSVAEALQSVALDALVKGGWGRPPRPSASPSPVSVTATHSPIYVGGRYIKRSRELSQTPWLVFGKRMMESSVQEIIFEPLAEACGMSSAEAEYRLKFMSAGREDVDVRCLGDGRPFAIEITDPRRELTAEQLQQVCDKISSGGQVVVKKLVPVTKEDLVILKSGEETKCKTYEVLCIKLAHSFDSTLTPEDPITVTDEDIAHMNSYRNTPAAAPERIRLAQRTPLRVLHRRPLLTRTKYVLDLTAAKVPGHPQLLLLRLRTSAGAYVKELVHGELRRTRPALAAAARAPLDVLALDVTDVQLRWPPTD